MELWTNNTNKQTKVLSSIDGHVLWFRGGEDEDDTTNEKNPAEDPDNDPDDLGSVNDGKELRLDVLGILLLEITILLGPHQRVKDAGGDSEEELVKKLLLGLVDHVEVHLQLDLRLERQAGDGLEPNEAVVLLRGLWHADGPVLPLLVDQIEARLGVPDGSAIVYRGGIDETVAEVAQVVVVQRIWEVGVVDHGVEVGRDAKEVNLLSIVPKDDTTAVVRAPCNKVIQDIRNRSNPVQRNRRELSLSNGKEEERKKEKEDEKTESPVRKTARSSHCQNFQRR